MAHRQQLSAGKDPAQVPGGVVPGVLVPAPELPLHAAGADGGQQGRRRFRAEQEGRIGRALLHQLQQHVLVPLVQGVAVREDIHLGGPVVGPDIGVLPQPAQQVHRQLPVVGVLHRLHVRVDVLHHLAALAALQAGPPPLRLALHGGGGEAGGGHAVPAAGENDGMGQCAALGGPAQAAGQCAVFRQKLPHGSPSLPWPL